MAVYFWVYRQRSEDEPEHLSKELADGEYQNLRPLLRSRWPGGLRKIRMTPAPGTGVRISLAIDRSDDAIERFIQASLQARNHEQPFARLRMERFHLLKNEPGAAALQETEAGALNPAGAWL
jgi:hypothetical protein